MEPIEERRQEILDGKRAWSYAEFNGDPDTFHTQVVVPLRQLKAEGLFDEAREIFGSVRGVKFVRSYNIISPINFNA